MSSILLHLSLQLQPSSEAFRRIPQLQFRLQNSCVYEQLWTAQI